MKKKDMEEKYYEILRHYVNPNDCATVVKQLLSLHNVVSTFICDTCKDKGSIAYWHKTGMGIKPCKCKQHSIKTSYGFEVCTKCGNEWDK